MDDFVDVWYYPTSALHSISAETNNFKVDITVLHQMATDEYPDLPPREIFATTLYPNNGTVELSDAGSLIERYFKQQGLVVGWIIFRFDESEIRVHSLYCERVVSDSYDPFSEFFLSTPVQRVYSDSFITLAVADRELPFSFAAVGYDENGDLEIARWAESPRMPQCTAEYSVAEILSQAFNAQTDGERRLSDIRYFSVRYGDIQKMFYIASAPSHLTFAFRNHYNVKEFVDIVGVMNTKTEQEVSHATCSHRIASYDRSVTMTYEIQTEALPAAEFPLFEQFLTSSTVELLSDDGRWVPVIISDFSCESSSDDETFSSIKFEWTFADDRPRVYRSVLNGIMPSRRNIFNPSFSAEYE